MFGSIKIVSGLCPESERDPKLLSIDVGHEVSAICPIRVVSGVYGATRPGRVGFLRSTTEQLAHAVVSDEGIALVHDLEPKPYIAPLGARRRSDLLLDEDSHVQ